jgi:hypothetical protein
MLAVAAPDYGGIEEVRPLRFGVRDGMTREANDLDVEPVEWDDEPKGFVEPLRIIEGDMPSASIQYRIAEDGLRISGSTTRPSSAAATNP